MSLILNKWNICVYPNIEFYQITSKLPSKKQSALSTRNNNSTKSLGAWGFIYKKQKTSLNQLKLKGGSWALVTASRRWSGLQGWLDPGSHPMTACFSSLPGIQPTLRRNQDGFSKTPLCNSVQGKQEEGYLLKLAQERGKPFLEATCKCLLTLKGRSCTTSPIRTTPAQEDLSSSKTRGDGPWLQGGRTDWQHGSHLESGLAGISGGGGVETDVNKQPGVVSVP